MPIYVLMLIGSDDLFDLISDVVNVSTDLEKLKNHTESLIRWYLDRSREEEKEKEKERYGWKIVEYDENFHVIPPDRPILYAADESSNYELLPYDEFEMLPEDYGHKVTLEDWRKKFAVGGMR